MGMDVGSAGGDAAAGDRAVDRGRSPSDQRGGGDGVSGARGLAMLVTDAAKLRWMGVDMRSRWRRRVAVVLTYAVFLVAVWIHPRRTMVVLQVLFYAQLMSGLWALLE